MSLLFNIWKLLLESMGYLFSFFSRHLSIHCFRYLDTCPFFPILFFLHSHIPLSAIRKFQERHLQELGAFISNKYFCVFSQCRSKTFLVNRKHVIAYSQCRSSRKYVECMWFWSWKHDKFLNKGHKVWPNSIQTQVVYIESLSILYMALIRHCYYYKGEVYLFILLLK
jgi:hypothetical protein